MIKFFRRIRQQLIYQGSMRKYVLYSIGEILLVVIGILLALQINNWNEWRKDRIQEQLLLQEIHKEFKYNKSEFEFGINRYKVVRENTEAIIQYFPINLQNVDLDSLAKHFESIGWVGNFDYSATTIAKLKNTASFDIISNEELRNLLLQWEVLATDYIKDEAMTIKFMQDRFYPIISNKLPRPYREGFKDSRVDLNFLTTLEFESLIKRRHNRVANLFRIFDEEMNIVTVTDRIIELSVKK